jgi:hypothetical protein
LELPEGLKLIDDSYECAYEDDWLYDYKKRIIYGCRSLVNLVMPSKQRIHGRLEAVTRRQ